MPIRVVEGAVAALGVGVTNAAAAWTVAEQASSPVINESTLIPIGAALVVLGTSITVTYKLAMWMAAKEQREKEQYTEMEQLKARLEALEQANG